MVDEINICQFDRNKDKEVRATKDINHVDARDTLSKLFEKQIKLIGNEIVFNKGEGI